MPALSKSKLTDKIASAPKRRTEPLWQGPCAAGPNGGVTQSMLQRFLSCRERFRVKYVLGLEPPDVWNKHIGYGNMWHVCEEALAAGWSGDANVQLLTEHTQEQINKYPMQAQEIQKWYCVCRIQFPEYVKYWSQHPDVKGRTPLMQEQVFDVPYALPSGRVVRLRGKFDSVDLIDGGVYIQENKSKGDIDEQQLGRQMRFDLQTMTYIVALRSLPSCDLPREGYYRHGGGTASNGTVRSGGASCGEYPIRGVRYNVVRRPLSGGKGSIRPHAEKATKNKFVPAETDDEFYERLRRDYIAAEPQYWFFRLRCEVSQSDIDTFKRQCLTPLLEQLCDWYDMITASIHRNCSPWELHNNKIHWRHPFGGYNALDEGGSTEYDAMLDSGSESGLRQVDRLFTELQ